MDNSGKTEELRESSAQCQSSAFKFGLICILDSVAYAIFGFPSHITR